MVVDHINGDTLDNRRENLRACTIAQNGINSRRQTNNTSGHKCVYYHKNRNMWYVRTRVDGQDMFKGYYSALADAITARNELFKLHGEYARTT